MQRAQVFDDIIIETLAKTGGNKTLELRLFWIASLLAILFAYLLVRLFAPKTKQKAPKKYPQPFYTVPVLLFPNICHFIIFGSLSKPLLLLTGMAIAAYFCVRELSIHVLAFQTLCYHAFMGIATLLAVLDIITFTHAFLLATLLTLCLIIVQMLTKKDGIVSYAILYAQPFITLVLIVYFVDDYLYNGSRLQLPYAPFYYVFFALLLAILLIMQIIHVIRHHKDALTLPLSKLISRMSVITIFIYNSYSACPMFAQPDQHHHGEQMIPWQQAITLGQTLYEEYTPVSGLFPMVIGFIQNILLGGTISDYSPAVSILMVLICILTMYLVYEHIGGVWALAISVLFALPCYNRQYLVLPLLLLLTLPRLIEKRREWLLCWLFGCFLAGLYYPLFGAAVLLGTLPFALWQLMQYLKAPKNFKAIYVYLEYAVVLLPIICSIPLLLKMLIHTLTYSNQTVLADGIALAGQNVPDFFMPLLAGHGTLLKLCYFGLRFSLPLLGLVAFATMIFLTKEKTKRLLYLAGLLTLCISYTYTLVRSDTDVILSRTSYILVALCGIYLTTLLLRNSEHSAIHYATYLFIAVLLSLPSLIYQNVSSVKTPAMWVYPNGDSNLYFDDNAKLFSFYEVNDVFAKSEDTGLSDADKKRLGPGFMVKDQLGYITSYRAVIDKCEAVQKDNYYYGFDGQGFYAYLGVKCCYTGFIPAAKGYDAQQVIVDRMKETRPVVFLMEPQSNYYAYYYMMTNDYIYEEDDQCYYPAELYQKIYPDANLPEKTIDDALLSPLDLGNVPNAFGSSIDTLLPLMTNESEFTYHFAGTDYDFIAVKLNTQAIIDAANAAGVTPPSHLTVDFACEGEAYPGNHITCDIGDGTLLIPVGMHASWLQAKDISHIAFSFDSDANSSAYASCIEELKLYKIRQ